MKSLDDRELLAAIVDRQRGLDGSEPVIRIWPELVREFLEYDPKTNFDWQPQMIDALGINSLARFPMRYEDRRTFTPIASLEAGRGATCCASGCQFPATAPCHPVSRNAMGPSPSGIGAGSSLKAPGCTRRWIK